MAYVNCAPRTHNCALMKNFIAIDFETATARRASICEVGICVVRGGEVAETRSWLVRPEHNRYHYWNIRVHGITPEETEDAPDFDQVWEEIEQTYLDEFDTFVAHNVPFDRAATSRGAVTDYGTLQGLPSGIGVFASYTQGQAWATGDQSANFMFNQQVGWNGSSW